MTQLKMPLKLLLNYLRLLRISMPILVVVVFLWALKLVNFTGLDNIIYPCIALFCLTAGGFAINDSYDYEKDKFTKPKRPVASGFISPREARVIGFLLLIISVVAGRMSGLSVLLYCLIVFAMLRLYSSIKACSGLVANLYTAILCASPFFLAGIISGQIKKIIIPIILTVLYIVPREILKDIDDIEGDSQFALKTVPIRYGIRSALRLAGIIWSLFLGFACILYIKGIFSPVQGLIILVSVVLPLLVSFYLMKQSVEHCVPRVLSITHISLLGSIVMLCFA